MLVTLDPQSNQYLVTRLPKRPRVFKILSYYHPTTHLFHRVRSLPETVTPSKVVKEDIANGTIKSEGFTSESDESDLSTANTKDDAIMSKDSSQISIETGEYSDNIHQRMKKL